MKIHRPYYAAWNNDVTYIKIKLVLVNTHHIHALQLTKTWAHKQIIRKRKQRHIWARNCDAMPNFCNTIWYLHIRIWVYIKNLLTNVTCKGKWFGKTREIDCGSLLARLCLAYLQPMLLTNGKVAIFDEYKLTDKVQQRNYFRLARKYTRGIHNFRDLCHHLYSNASIS
jgi:hypothetical protein